MGMLSPNWYKNLSVHWSKKEQKLQQDIAKFHAGMGEQLLKTIEGVDWGDEVEYTDLKPIVLSWQEKLYQEEGIIL